MAKCYTNVLPKAFFVIVFSLFTSSFLVTLSEAQMVPAIYVFGDSLVDVGNNDYLKISVFKADFPHNGVDYPGKVATGRWGNGKNSADFLAEKVGLPTSPPYLSLVSKSNKRKASFVNGVSFASGGAGIFNGSDEQYNSFVRRFMSDLYCSLLSQRQAIPLSYQVNYYSEVHQNIGLQLGSKGAKDHLSKSLFLIVIGSNDIFGYFRNSQLQNEYTLQQYADLMVSNLKKQLQRMHALGAQKFVVIGTGPVGCCPAQRNSSTGECNHVENSMSVMYNEALKSMLQQLKPALGIGYTLFDTYTVLTNIVQNGASYGFTEVRAACCGMGKLNAEFPCTPVSSLCSNRRNHVFWDFYHPTQATHGIITDKLFDGPSKYSSPMTVKELIAQ
ncbi:GDSL esterase/lipase [Pyrus ussuriensis x Pyrus communis]|uniref:GDSL esterase/lipase n=1 Tax=Pyrus ussuriensis x Pyrus communis TaxID=2448454 RepID=A0A5N5GJD9_9ROSA|nr:GDSL esterase/lipase [Pyrus ussuriensis x Pyrus communis]